MKRGIKKERSGKKKKKNSTHELSMDVELRQQKPSFEGRGASKHPRRSLHRSTSRA